MTYLPEDYKLPEVCANCAFYKFDLDWTDEQKEIYLKNDHLVPLESDKQPTNRRCTRRGILKTEVENSCCNFSPLKLAVNL